MRAWLRRRIWEPILAQLRQGLSPRGLAWSVALGAGIAIFPMLGSTTLLCFLVALAFRLNQPAMQTANYAAYPLQLLLFVPLIRLGERIFGAPRLPLSLPVILHAMRTDLWGSIRFFWTSVWHAAVAWTLVVLPLACVLALLLSMLFHRFVPRPSEAR